MIYIPKKFLGFYTFYNNKEIDEFTELIKKNDRLSYLRDKQLEIWLITNI